MWWWEHFLSGCTANDEHRLTVRYKLRIWVSMWPHFIRSFWRAIESAYLTYIALEKEKEKGRYEWCCCWYRHLLMLHITQMLWWAFSKQPFNFNGSANFGVGSHYEPHRVLQFHSTVTFGNISIQMNFSLVHLSKTLHFCIKFLDKWNFFKIVDSVLNDCFNIFGKISSLFINFLPNFKIFFMKNF